MQNITSNACPFSQRQRIVLSDTDTQQASITRDADGNLVTTLGSALTRTATLLEKASTACRNDPGVKKAAARRKGLAAAEGSCLIGSGNPDDMSPEFKECLTKAVATDLAKKESEANKNMRMLELVGDRARNYTCADPEMETTNVTLSTMNWKDPEGDITYQAKVRSTLIFPRILTASVSHEVSARYRRTRAYQTTKIVAVENDRKVYPRCR